MYVPKFPLERDNLRNLLKFKPISGVHVLFRTAHLVRYARLNLDYPYHSRYSSIISTLMYLQMLAYFQILTHLRFTLEPQNNIYCISDAFMKFSGHR